MASLPDLWDEDLLLKIQKEIRQYPTEIFVLDDDPTGAQTVRDVAVLTEWSTQALLKEFDTIVLKSSKINMDHRYIAFKKLKKKIKTL